MDEGIAVHRDWGPVNPSSRYLFASSHQGDLGHKPSSDFAMESFKERPLPEMQKNHDASDVSLGTDGRGGVGNGSSSKSCDLSMDNGSSRGGLVERIAARAGFHAPKLNTARAKFASLSSSAMDISSPYVTIPPGLSPTTLLDSPIFLVNPLTLPSPTTGKLPLGHNAVNVLSSVPEVSYNDVLFDADLFAFRSALEANNLYLHDRVDEGSSLNQQVPIQLESQNQSRTIDANVCSPSHGTGPDSEEQKLEHSSVCLGLQLEDGYNWRKYGQKQVKGSEYPRGYYKCTHPNCQAKKKIERSQEGQITDIVYKGAHNHPKPPPNRRAALSSQEQTNIRENQAQLNGADMWSTMTQCEADRVGDRTEGSSYAPQTQRMAWFESTQDQEVDQANHGSGSLENEINDNEFESKRRKLDHPLIDLNPASRTAREPRIVVQTTSDIDVLDDGYRWRKYGQKVVKGNPNPRSYYKCTSAGCNVRKHVERASHDLKSVITTYEGRHNHDVPVARTANNHVSFAPSSIHSHSVSKTSESYIAQDSSLPLLASQTQPPLDAFQHQERRETVGGFCLGAGQLGQENNAIPGAVSMNMVPQVLMDTGYQGVNQARFLLVPKEDIKIESIPQMGTQIPNMASLCQQVIGGILPSGS